VADQRLNTNDVVQGALSEPDGFVEVMFAKSKSEASQCCQVLGEQSIPARVEDDDPAAHLCGVAVLVPAAQFLEASELLASLSQHDDDLEADYEDEEEDEELDDEEDYDDEFDDDEDDDYDDDDEFEEDDPE